mmetsp:Transcript_25821/g.29767  ORF Transcript_25821/g.29767 Transcript_25821/m.29767 type:complete len:82 (+) Transcript_25821:653-898(+)
MGKEKKNARKLKLVNSDIVKYGLKDYLFTKATFNNGAETSECLIVTSVGDYIVVWNLAKAANGSLADYDIKKLPGEIIASE